MKKSSRKVTCEAFRVYAGTNEAKSRLVWIDLWGNSYHGIASTPSQAKQMARQFRETAKWLETKGVSYLKG
jgi:hypothetical protein